MFLDAASPIPVFFYLISNETCPALCANFMSKNHHIKEDIAKLSITDLDNKLASWMIALKLLFHIDVDRLSYEKLSNLIEQVNKFTNLHVVVIKLLYLSVDDITA